MQLRDLILHVCLWPPFANESSVDNIQIKSENGSEGSKQKTTTSLISAQLEPRARGNENVLEITYAQIYYPQVRCEAPRGLSAAHNGLSA